MWEQKIWEYKNVRVKYVILKNVGVKVRILKYKSSECETNKYESEVWVKNLSTKCENKKSARNLSQNFWV